LNLLYNNNNNKTNNRGISHVINNSSRCVYEKRESKHWCLLNSEINNIDWTKLELKTNFEPWIKFDSSLVNYDKHLFVADIFNAQTPCVRTHKDKEFVSFSKFNTKTNQEDLFKAFDNRFVDLDLKKMGRSRIKVMHHENSSLITPKRLFV
jgi:hypothetical protein